MKLKDTFEGSSQPYCKGNRLNVSIIEESTGQSVYFAHSFCREDDDSAYIIIEQKNSQGNVETFVFLCEEKCEFSYNDEIRANTIINYDKIIENNLPKAKEHVHTYKQ